MINKKLDEKDMVLLELCKIAIGDLPKTFLKNNENIWKAFDLGRKFETTPRVEIKK